MSFLDKREYECTSEVWRLLKRLPEATEEVTKNDDGKTVRNGLISTAIPRITDRKKGRL